MSQSKSREFTATDSVRGVDLPDHRIYSVAYEPVWQGIRYTSIFNTEEGCRATIARLTAYLKTVDRNNEDELRNRLWRIYRLLSGLPVDKTWGPGIRQLPRSTFYVTREFRSEIEPQLKDLGYPKYWDWAVTWRACESMWKSESGAAFLEKLWKKLAWGRTRNSPYKLEMFYFLDIIVETQPNE